MAELNMEYLIACAQYKRTGEIHEAVYYVIITSHDIVRRCKLRNNFSKQFVKSATDYIVILEKATSQAMIILLIG